MKNKFTVIFSCIILGTVLSACSNNAKQGDLGKQENTAAESTTKNTSAETTASVTAKKGKIILATTTSTQDSGLLDELLPDFTQKTGWEVDTIAVGTGEALKMGENGEADVLLVHAKAKEEAFIQAGHGLKRFDVMYNDFVVVGPKGKIEKNNNAEETFRTIFDNKDAFVSRGDESGTHTKELSIWKNLNITPADNPNYISAGQGMGATLLMADEKKACTLSDRATWLATKSKTAMDIVCEKDEQLLNYYGVIAVNPEKSSKINAEGAQDFINWILSDDTQKLIGDFGVKEYGESLFTPDAAANK
nr:substrate-binding domain-containing protein [uncultured Clostridium sp.]